MRKVLAILSVSALLLIFSPVFIASADDFDLPPPDMEDDFMPPPPGDDMAGMEDDAPPPPMEDDMGGDEMAPPPMEEEEEASAPPSMEDDADAPPPLEDEFASDDEGLAPPPMEEEEEMAPPPAKAAVKTVKKAAETIPQAGSSKYTVVKGDSLWRIAGRSKIYNNSFKWPLLYKANKSSIEDPDLIYPKQSLQVRKNFTSDEVEDAVNKAKETPPYEPHTTPRKQLPIKY